jgi:hypothetical protein
VGGSNLGRSQSAEIGRHKNFKYKSYFLPKSKTDGADDDGKEAQRDQYDITQREIREEEEIGER